MGSSVGESLKKLWDTWNIRGLIILSLLLQSFLILFAQLRKQRGEKWVFMIPIWIAYLLADWVAIFTIGLILHTESSDIITLWAPFLLLHLGGPDTITSFSLEDNEFWIRHLLGLMLQVGSTIYVILESLPQNRLWLPTLLLLTAGTIKYAERNRAFYLASFDHFGNNWASVSALIPHVPVQFAQFVGLVERIEVVPNSTVAVYLLGAVKNLLVGPPMSSLQKWNFDNVVHKISSHEMLRIIEIHLSLLYELLHTKLPVVDSKIGYVCRVVNFGCIFGALLSFSLLKKHYYKLEEFDIWLTYGLLIGAVALDLISIMLLIISSDWIIIAHPKKMGWELIDKKKDCEFTDRRRWSNSVPQLNILASCFKNKDGVYPSKSVDFLGIRSLLETIRRILCASSKDFAEDQAWNFIFTTLKERYDSGKGIFHLGILNGDTDTNFAWSLTKFEHMESLLMWHIATEICYRKGAPDNNPNSTSTSRSSDHREICKLLSDYMFYLLMLEPTMIAISPNNLKLVFEGLVWNNTWKWLYFVLGENASKETFIKDLDKQLVDKEKDSVEKLLKKINTDADKLPIRRKTKINEFSMVTAACYLAKELLNHPECHRWEIMGKVWVKIVCYAAMKCQPIVHARQVSRGGQLLTLVWLLMNYLGLTPSKDWFDVLERKEPADQNKELKEPAHRL